MLSSQSNNSPALAPAAIQKWGQVIGSEKVATLIAKSERFAGRAKERVYKAHKLTGSSQNGPRPATWVYLNNKNQFTRLCGLIMYGATIRKIVTPAEYEIISRNFPREDLTLACRQTDLHIHNNDIQIADEGLVEIISRAGETLIQTWISALPQAQRTELALFGEETHLSQMPKLTRIDPEISIAIAQRVSHLLTL